MYPHWLRLRLGVAVLALPLIAAAPAKTPEHFPSPDAAVQALVTAVRSDNTAQLTALFGKAGMQIVSTGDPAANKRGREKFIAAYETKHEIDTKGTTATLSVGTDAWPFPIPLMHTKQGWSFNVAAGANEILTRRIGANELYVQQVVLAYVDAQNEYVKSLHDGLKLHVYAQHLLSSPGKQDGLYWPTEEGQPESPLGPLVAEARAAGYEPGKHATPEPFHGYFFHILTAQGPHAPGGAYSYMANGQMLGGFALVAWPAHWNNSGVMTFLVNQDGQLYQKNLGPKTAEIAHAMKTFDPDASWQKIGAPAPLPGEATEGSGG